MPFAVLAQGLNMLALRLTPLPFHKVEKQLKTANYHLFRSGIFSINRSLTFRSTYIFSSIFWCQCYRKFCKYYARKLMTGFTVASGLLPAVGFAMLIQGMIDKNQFLIFHWIPFSGIFRSPRSWCSCCCNYGCFISYPN